MHYIDTHAHLNLLENWEEGVENAQKADVKKIITINTDLASLESFCKEGIYYTVGLHPCNECTHTPSQVYEILDSVCALGKVVGIGETGLDAYGPDQNYQQEIFSAHLETAIKYDLPLVVHSRDMDELLLCMLKKYQNAKGVLHCWTGSLETAQQAINLGWMVSFSGILTFRKKVEHLWEQAKTLPLNHILLETDSPYLAPHPFRGRVNEPKNVILVYKWLSELRCTDEHVIKAQIWENAHNLFKL